MIVCTKCGASKCPSEFFDDKRKRNGKSSWCKECSLSYKAEWRSKYKHREQMTGAEYRRKQKEQRPDTPPRSASCEICGHTFTNTKHDVAAWDHNHATGKFRGWLCRFCNNMLGLAKDNPEILRLGADYLSRRGHE